MRFARCLFFTVLTLGCASGTPMNPRPEPDGGGGRDAGEASGDAGPARRDAMAPSRDAGPCTPVEETCNGRDDDCDGAIDEDPTDGTLFYRDLDGDGWGSDTDTVMACARPDDAVERGGDCQDGSHLVNPGSLDTCDGLDNDCAGGVDDPGCPPGCTPVAFGGHGYAFCDEDLPWTDARRACEAMGMLMVRVDNAAENEFLWTTAGTTGIGDYFIGASVEVGATRWRWADGTEFWEGTLGGSAVGGLYAAWEGDQPDDDMPPSCAVARDREAGRWHDTSCAAPNDYVCERY